MESSKYPAEPVMAEALAKAKAITVIAITILLCKAFLILVR
jgi:hypothetical protein